MYLLIGVTAFPRCKYPFFGHFSLIATDLTDWFRGSALEPTDLQALPAESSSIRVSLSLRSEAKPRGQCVPKHGQNLRESLFDMYDWWQNRQSEGLPSIGKPASGKITRQNEE